jgi:hypothetical protein
VNDCATATAATASVVYGAAGAMVAHGVRSVTISFSATPTGTPTFSITSGGNTIFGPVQVQATAIAQTFLDNSPKLGFPNQDLTLTLTSGGAGIVGNISVGQHWISGANQTLAPGMGGLDFRNSLNAVFAF